MTGRSPKIAIRGLEKRFGAKAVLRGLDLDVMEGESLVVIGASGSGKSVLIKNIVGILAPDAGSILYDGAEIAGLAGTARDRVNRGIGMLFQNGALFDSLPLWENVAFPLLSTRAMPRSGARERSIELLREVGLGPETADRYPADVSVGAQKRAGLARAIAAAPEMLFFDEPTTGIDPVMGAVIDRLIVKCVRDLGATALTITHDMESARRIGNRIAMIHDGRVIWIGNVGDIARSGNDVVDAFVRGRRGRGAEAAPEAGV